MPLKKMTRVLWEEYKDRIWRWYMVEDLTLKDILQNFKNDGISVNKNQLDFKLTTWNMRKNITEEEAKWMANQMDNQVAGNSIVFVRSGKRLQDDRVEAAIQKHARRPTLLLKFPSLIASITSPTPQNPGPNGLIVCRPGSDDMNVNFSPSLPWIKFKSALLDRSIRIEIVPGSQSQSPLQQILPWTLRDDRTGSTDFQMCMIASRLGQFMPEAYIGEHVRGVHSMMRSWPSDPAAVLEILMFQLSINFLDQDFDDYAVIRLIRLAGLDTSKAIRSLMRAANAQPTIAAVLDQIWKAAWRTRSVDTAAMSSAERKTLGCEGINSHLQFQVGVALTHSISSEDLSLAKAIIGPGSASITQQLGRFCGENWRVGLAVYPIYIVERMTVETSAIISINHREHNTCTFTGYLNGRWMQGAISVPPYSEEAEERSITTYRWLMEKLSALGNLPEQERDAGDTGKLPNIELLVLASPLGAAVLGNHPDTYRVLLSMGAAPKFKPSHTGYPGLLHLAAWTGAELLINLLIEYGIDADEPSIFPGVYESVYSETASLSALAFAIICHNWKAATLLVRLGAIIGSVELCLAVEIYNGTVISSPMTLLEIALDCGHRKMCEIISEEYGLSVDSELLPRAVKCGSSELVSQTLKANPLSINPQLLIEAATNALKNGMSDITERLFPALTREITKCFL
ncbi:hypothetical protein SUNI508_13260 [Seiridium unicorne]|uniref:Clr5 domain-containing protein n=1 Tax=Seiridium unicorne TaxID=138068 RepID=A0ABR2VEU6_9PEZI